MLIFGYVAQAQEYDVNFWRQVYKDTLTRAYSSSDFLYNNNPVGYPTCTTATMSEEAKDRALNIINKIRELHELSNLVYDHTSQTQVEEAALYMLANETITHTPTILNKCYSTNAKNGAGSSNIYSGGRNTDSFSHFSGWLTDTSDISKDRVLGHRRWILNPFQYYFSYAQAYGYSAMKTFYFSGGNSSSPTVDFVAYPYEKYPYLLFESGASWSFTVIEYKSSWYDNKHTYFSSAAISVKNKATNAKLSISNKITNYDGYGIPNILMWNVSGVKYNTWYTVIISNVKMQSGVTKSFSYDVYIDKAGVQKEPNTDDGSGSTITNSDSIIPILNYLLN